MCNSYRHYLWYPEEIEQFWIDAYTEIDSIGNKIAQIQQNGYRLVATFVLPDECWTENYYVPQRRAQEIFLSRYSNNDTAKDFINNQRREAELYSKYKAYYGYVFYIAQKTA